MDEFDAKIDIKIEKNKLEATATYTPPKRGGESLTVEAVESKLKAMNIVSGIKLEVIEKICDSERPLRFVTIAEAIPPKIGKRAVIESYFDLNKERKALEKEDGSVDFRDLGDICSAKTGQELYRKIPPTIGESGCNVLGEEIPGLPGKDLNIILGHGTSIDENDPNLYIATADGEIYISKGVVHVSAVHNVIGDVDFSTGNIKFNGSIIINGTVKSGFKVQADGDVEVKKNVEDAQIDAGGDIVIKGGFTGKGQGLVQSGRDVYVKFVENQSIRAERDIILYGESYHTTMISGRSILTKGKTRAIVGGTCEAKVSVEAGKLGTSAGTSTIIKVGIDPKFADRKKTIEDLIADSQENFEKIHKSTMVLYGMKKDNKGFLPPEKIILLAKMEKIKLTMSQKIELLQSDMQTLIREQKKMENAFISADVAVFPKVIVYFGSHVYSVTHNLGPSEFRFIKGDIVKM